MNPIKAIRLHCLDCSCGSTAEVAECQVVKCKLYPFRMGTNPYRKKREMTDEQREALATRLAEARARKDSEND